MTSFLCAHRATFVPFVLKNNTVQAEYFSKSFSIQ